MIWKQKEKVTIMAETADFVKNKINNGTYSVANKHKGKSVICSTLCDLLKDDETVLDGWVFCSQCIGTPKLILPKCRRKIKKETGIESGK